MDDVFADLDDAARLALDVALGTAAALGDRECGTEYLLLGIFATARAEMAEVGELFVLDELRIERAIQKIRDGNFSGAEYDGDPPLSVRARAAARTRRHDGTGPTGVFELLAGVLADEASGACSVLRELGVRPEEVRRLAAYGTRHLTKEEAAVLLEMLDRRSAERHRPWWGPAPEARVVPVRIAGGHELEVARSVSAVATIDDLVTSGEGFSLSLRIESLRPWVLPPALEPPEILVPGRPPTHRVGPDMLRFEIVFADGDRVSNLQPVERWRIERPTSPTLVPLSSRTEITRTNDRRRVEHRVIVTQWWVWPLPAAGTIEVRLDWPAEVLSGLVSFDGRPLLDTASRLRVSS
ncbi:MAG TPA: Clp protease N-terminal domain-containing protein [Acidimicrobiales bacterium]|nr:Clp protease N-terminal domain-containing protein [Acidimicrobiales bacterium]